MNNKYVNLKIENNTSNDLPCRHYKNEVIYDKLTDKCELAITRFSIPITRIPLIKWDDSFENFILPEMMLFLIIHVFTIKSYL